VGPVLALAATMLALAAPVHCDTGATMFVDGPLRVFGKGFHTHEAGYTTGHDHYACLGRQGPIQVGTDVQGGGAFGAGTDMYVFAGGRYLAAATYNYGEGGGDQTLTVYDLRTKRVIKSARGLWDEDEGPLVRLSANGDLLQQEVDGQSINAVVVYTRGRKARVLSTPGVDATAIAVAGTTVYWTEPDGPHATTLPGAASDEPDDVLAPVGFSRSNPCDTRAGTTLARTPHVRVARRHETSFACRVGSRRAVPLARAARDLHVAGDRWLYYAAGDQAFVVDMSRDRLVTAAPKGVRSTLLPNGALAWTDAAGQLQAQKPGAAPVTLESAGASALTSTGTTVYWTAGGVAHSSTAAA
jgi:hypothetical protein